VLLRYPTPPLQNDIARLKAEGGGEAGGDGEGDHFATVGPLRTFGMSVACVSRAGREPGYKKTNQDSCFAFERFIGDNESLFGAMDGHGPHGERREELWD
jgi:hypothetical protein